MGFDLLDLALGTLQLGPIGVNVRIVVGALDIFAKRFNRTLPGPFTQQG